MSGAAVNIFPLVINTGTETDESRPLFVFVTAVKFDAVCHKQVFAKPLPVFR